MPKAGLAKNATIRRSVRKNLIAIVNAVFYELLCSYILHFLRIEPIFSRHQARAQSGVKWRSFDVTIRATLHMVANDVSCISIIHVVARPWCSRGIYKFGKVFKRRVESASPFYLMFYNYNSVCLRD